MPAKSKAQQKAAGAALAAKRGDMKKAELKDLAETKRKKLPERKTAE